MDVYPMLMSIKFASVLYTEAGFFMEIDKCIANNNNIYFLLL